MTGPLPPSNITFDAPHQHDEYDECDGCGTREDETQLLYDYGVPVCQYCVEGGDIRYNAPIIDENGVVGFTLEYSLQKDALCGDDVIYGVFLRAGLESAEVEYKEHPFCISVKLSKGDALIFKLKNLKDTILHDLLTYVF